MTEEAPIQWLTTGASRPNGEPRGWKLHAVRAFDEETCDAIKRRPAACGLTSSHGWGVDIFIEQRCARCLRAVGLACPECRGRGWNDHRPCYACRTTGVRNGTKERRRVRGGDA